MFLSIHSFNSLTFIQFLFKSDLYLVISVVVLYMYFFVFFEKKNIHLIFVPVLIFTIYINSGKFLNFYDSYISSYSFYISNTFVNFENLFFGFNNSNELYEVKTSKNFYLDFIYNFGLLALIPFLNLIFYTIKKIRFQKSGYINNDMIFFIFFIFILPFLTLSLGDIFVGSIVYLYWSTLLNSNQL